MGNGCLREALGRDEAVYAGIRDELVVTMSRRIAVTLHWGLRRFGRNGIRTMTSRMR